MVGIYVVFRLTLIQVEYFYYLVPGIHENMLEKSTICIESTSYRKKKFDIFKLKNDNWCKKWPPDFLALALGVGNLIVAIWNTFSNNQI